MSLIENFAILEVYKVWELPAVKSYHLFAVLHSDAQVLAFKRLVCESETSFETERGNKHIYQC